MKKQNTANVDKAELKQNASIETIFISKRVRMKINVINFIQDSN